MHTDKALLDFMENNKIGISGGVEYFRDGWKWYSPVGYPVNHGWCNCESLREGIMNIMATQHMRPSHWSYYKKETT